MSKKFTPKGKPLLLDELKKIADVNLIDIRRSLNDSNKKLREYLRAKESLD